MGDAYASVRQRRSHQERLTHARTEALIKRMHRANQADATLARLIASIADDGEKQPDAAAVRSSPLEEKSL